MIASRHSRSEITLKRRQIVLDSINRAVDQLQIGIFHLSFGSECLLRGVISASLSRFTSS